MSIVFLLLPTAILLGFGFLAAFVWGAAKGQYDDLVTPAHRILLPDSGSKENVDSFERPVRPSNQDPTYKPTKESDTHVEHQPEQF